MFEEYQHEEEHYSVHFGQDEVEEYDDTGVPNFLKCLYVILPIWGIIWFSFFWNGSVGWLDRGYWQELSEAARTTFKNGQVQTVEYQNSMVKQEALNTSEN